MDSALALVVKTLSAVSLAAVALVDLLTLEAVLFV
jgi:hypothetical protein